MRYGFLSPQPACGHSECSQCYIETGDPRCVATLADEYAPRPNAFLVGAALAIRAVIPDLGLADALTYANPSTVQGKAFRRGLAGHGFCGTGFDRYSFACGLAWYVDHWSPDEDRRLARILHRLRIKRSILARLETQEEETKRAYGAIIRSRPMPALMIAWERFKKRARGRVDVPAWPGTYNMPPVAPNYDGSEAARSRAWMRSVGLNPEAIEAFAPRPQRTEAERHMVANLDIEVQS